jgi:DNA-binding NtrC family response regulator
VYEAISGEEGLQIYESHRPDLVMLDLGLPGIAGIHVLELLSLRNAVVVMLTGQGDIPTAVEAMRLGAENFLTKPVHLEQVREAAERAFETAVLRRSARDSAMAAAEAGAPLLGTSPAMRELEAEIRMMAASTGTTVLLLGESGTGKGWVAQRIHSLSPRSRGPFVEINCAGLSATFLDSELFGHEQGAYTDAKTAKRGLFELAHNGTLFLDEIGDLAPDLQPKLLKALESKRFRRLGGTREIEVDVRLIAATNRDLAAEVRAGRFREDLFYRLNVLAIRLPPLRERAPEDTLMLIEQLLADLHRSFQRGARRISDQALRLLLGYDWPGNVRHLRNVLERALVLSAGTGEILPEHLPAEIRASEAVSRASTAESPMSLEEMERRHIERTLSHFDWNRTRAAESLGISRTTLHNKIRQYGLGADE